MSALLDRCDSGWNQGWERAGSMHGDHDQSQRWRRQTSILRAGRIPRGRPGSGVKRPRTKYLRSGRHEHNAEWGGITPLWRW